MRAALLDAGPIVGYLRADDVHHLAAVDAFERCASSGLALVTTWEAVSEAFTLLRTRIRGGAKTSPAFLVLEWAWESGVQMLAPEAADHRRCRQILEGHRDLALSYCDALLLSVGERLEVTAVLTIDGAHFPAVKLASATAVTVLD